MVSNDDHIGIDPEDWDEVLGQVEDSYDIKFGENDLFHVKTLGEVIDVIEKKIVGKDVQDCTTQQAFYKIRSILTVQLDLPPASVGPHSSLEELVPRKDRRRIFGDMESTLGVKLNVFRLKGWLSLFLTILLVGSLTAFIWSTQVALVGITMFAVFLWISLSTTKELNVATVGHVAERLSQRAYRLMRRDRGTVNRKEIRRKLKSLFKDEFGLEDGQLRDEVLIVP